MRKPKTVTVYSFLLKGSLPEAPGQAPFKAPRDLIASRFKGQVLEGTGEEVSVEALDAEGRHRRVATGWGALPD